MENIFFEFEKIISEHLVQVRFSPLMTLPTTVKITAQDFETKLAWSALPGSIISVPAGQAMNHLFFPKRRFVAGFFRRLLVYIISCISISIIPPILFQYASLQYVLFQFVSIQYVSSSIQYISIQYVCISRNRIVLPLPPQRKVYFTETFSMSFLLSPAIRSSLSHRTYLSVDSPCIHVHKSRWWFQIFFIFTLIWGGFPI